MTKVCHITSVHPKEDVRIFQKECRSLAKAGYDVTLIQQGGSYEKDGVHVIGFGEIAPSRIQRMLSTSRKAYRKALEVDADIYHLHDPELLPYGIKLKKKGKKVIFDSHEHTAEAILEKEWLPAVIRKAVYSIYSRYQASVCTRLDAVVTVTPNIIEYFKQFQPNTVQVSNYPVYQEHALQSDKQRRIVFAGGINRQWNHHIIIEALNRIPQCRYLLCGSADTGYITALQNQKGWEYVDFMGKIPHLDVALHLAQSMVGIALLSPSRNTDWHKGTIGNTKIFEEMLAGLPVVCTDFDLWRDFVDRYHCGICVDPKNVDEIVDAITYLLDHPEEAKQMGENGRRAVKEEFNWGVEEKTLLALYKKILNY